MKKLLSILLTLVALFGFATKSMANEDPVLQFNQNGKFKVVYFTDTHISWREQEKMELVLNQCRMMIREEKPDLVIFGGDIVTGSPGAGKAYQKLESIFDDTDIPFIMLHGNHDRERDLAEWELAECYAGHKNSLNTITDGTIDDLAVRLLSSDGKKTAAVFYCMDSGDYSIVPDYWDYAWISHSQINWYINKSRQFTQNNKNVPVPSYSFFHIPLPEFRDAFNTDSVMGVRKENECPGQLNSGLLSAIEECADVHGIFTGHDHDNDYVAKAGNVAMAYGRYSGDNTIYNHLEKGVRIIEFTEGDYGFRTWIHERSGKIVEEYTHKVDMDTRLLKAVKAKAKKQGITRTTYTNVTSLADMETKATKGESIVMPFPHDFHDVPSGNLGYIYEGKIYVPEDGLWTFHASADNEVTISIDGVSFSDSNYGRGIRYYNLEKGYHDLKVKVFCHSNGIWFKMQWSNPLDDRMHEVPAKYYFVE